MATIAENLKRLRKEAKLSQAKLADLSGVSQQLISQIENGKNSSTKELPALAKALGASVGDIDEEYAADAPNLTGPAIAQSQTSPLYAGIVQAGTFRAVDEWFNQDPDQVPDHVRIDIAHSRIRQYAWQARGDSMNAAGIHDGMWVVGADAADYIDQYGDIITGDLVVVEQTRYQGSEREITVKEIHFFRDRYELRPVSSNETHKPISVPHDHKPEDDREVKIIGVVLTAYADLKKRRG